MKLKALHGRARAGRFRASIGLLPALALAACAGHGPRGPRDLRPIANPSAVVATELAFARAAQEKGQWTAFRDYADDDAVMFAPGLVNAKDWLKGRGNPAQSVAWQPYQVWSSCDGSLAATKGAWERPDGTFGYFVTVWKREGASRRSGGEYKWVFDDGDALKTPLAAPEMINASVAECKPRPTPQPDAAPTAAGSPPMLGWSDDRTLQWVADVAPDGSHRIKVRRWTGSGYEDVVSAEVAGE